MTAAGRSTKPDRVPGSRWEAGRVGAAACMAGGFGWIMAQVGIKGSVAGLAGMAALAALILTNRRELLALFGLVLSLVLLFHKSLGPITPIIHGPPSVYVTTFDVMIASLYIIWIWEGGAWGEIRAALSRPVFYLPLVGGFLMMLSLLDTRDLSLAAAELTRMAWMYLLYLYLGIRIRRRTQVMVVLGALAVFVLIQFAVVCLQWQTGGSLGLSFLDVPTQLPGRVLDAGQLDRPFGTLVHPALMGAAMGALVLVFFSVAYHLRNRRWKMVGLAVSVAAGIPILLAHTRAAAVAVLIAGLGLLLHGLGRRLITTRQLGISLGVLALVSLTAWPLVKTEIIDNFTGDRFSFEVEARLELNTIAVDMFFDEPLLGVGLNNYSQYQDDFDRYGLIFDEEGLNPVHNLFLLQMAETGLIGSAALVMVGLMLARSAWQLARARDRLLAGIGVGALAMYGFFVLEEMLSITLHHDVPRAVFFLVAGLVLGSLNLMDGERSETAVRPGVSIAEES